MNRHGRNRKEQKIARADAYSAMEAGSRKGKAAQEFFRKAYDVGGPENRGTTSNDKHKTN